MSLICRIGRFVSRPVGKNWHSSQTRRLLTVDTSSPGNHSVLKSMSRETFSRSGHLSAYATFQRITADAATRGLTLLSTEWSGARSSYLFRCERGHRFSRRGAIVLRSTITCLQCVRQDVQQRFLETLKLRGFTCEENAYLGQKVRQHFVCGVGHRWATQARRILEGSGCPECGAGRLPEWHTLTGGPECLRAPK